VSITAVTGPLIVFGQAPFLDYNPELGPSLFYGGVGLIDQRTNTAYEPGQNSGNIVGGWLGVDRIVTTVFTPSTLAANNIAASQTPVSGTALTLVSSSGAGVTVGAQITSASTGTRLTGLLLIDALTASSASSTISGNVFTTGGSVTGTFTTGSVLTGTGVVAGTTIIQPITGLGGAGAYLVDTPQTVSSTTIAGTTGTYGIPRVTFGQAGTIQLYNPLCMLGRNFRITTAAGDTAVYTAVGCDTYGYPLTESVTANGATTVSGKKAFKYFSSITPVGTVGATVTVGTGDVYGFPLLSGSFSDVSISWAGAAITSATGYTAAVTTSPATSATGDVRGTYATQSASNGSNQLIVVQSPSVVNVGSLTGLFGVTQA
jgi:hypothetical protein